MSNEKQIRDFVKRGQQAQKAVDKILQKQPPAGKFTKRFRELITLSEEHLSDNKIGRLRTYGKEACVRLDQQAEDNKDQEAENERLKEELSNLANEMVYEGNSVSYIYQKMTAYKNQIGVAGNIMRKHNLIKEFEQVLKGE